MERRALWLLKWIDVVQLGIIATGILFAAAGAWKLDAAYPLEFQMEPLVNTPIVAWGVFWLGVGVVIFGLGMNAPSPLETVDVVLFSERQRTGLLVAGLLIILPSMFAGLGRFLGFLLLYATVPAGLAGVAIAVVWRVGELVWPPS